MPNYNITLSDSEVTNLTTFLEKKVVQELRHDNTTIAKKLLALSDKINKQVVDAICAKK